mgnify:CR=1 FL=1
MWVKHIYRSIWKKWHIDCVCVYCVKHTNRNQNRYMNRENVFFSFIHSFTHSLLILSFLLLLLFIEIDISMCMNESIMVVICLFVCFKENEKKTKQKNEMNEQKKTNDSCCWNVFSLYCLTQSSSSSSLLSNWNDDVVVRFGIVMCKSIFCHLIFFCFFLFCLDSYDQIN